MTDLLERAVEAVRTLAPSLQDDIARTMLVLAGGDQPLIELSAQEQEALHEGEQAASNGEFASDEEVRAIWAKHGL